MPENPLPQIEEALAAINDKSSYGDGGIDSRVLMHIEDLLESARDALRERASKRARAVLIAALSTDTDRSAS